MKTKEVGDKKESARELTLKSKEDGPIARKRTHIDFLFFTKLPRSRDACESSNPSADVLRVARAKRENIIGRVPPKRRSEAIESRC